ncbi:hydrogenase maturation protease [Actinoplanes regularis]|uniref:hydrogenase maturation protease n=1 Tax=Actinoplanes regularis TaxID=52697 RepID=UPI00255542AF|nr:hydrogenase maturation protease [Actinoplanes regularis]
MTALVAGVGNIFLGDDGFGPEVARRLAAEPRPPGVRVVDYGIRGTHLAFDLLDGYDRLVLVDALAGEPPGELVLLEVGPQDLGEDDTDPHGMNPVAVLSGLSRLGGTLPPTYVVGCRAASVAEGIGLTPPVAAAVPAAVSAIRRLLIPPRSGRA